MGEHRLPLALALQVPGHPEFAKGVETGSGRASPRVLNAVFWALSAGVRILSGWRRRG